MCELHELVETDSGTEFILGIDDDVGLMTLGHNIGADFRFYLFFLVMPTRACTEFIVSRVPSTGVWGTNMSSKHQLTSIKTLDRVLKIEEFGQGRMQTRAPSGTFNPRLLGSMAPDDKLDLTIRSPRLGERRTLAITVTRCLDSMLLGAQMSSHYLLREQKIKLNSGQGRCHIR